MKIERENLRLVWQIKELKIARAARKIKNENYEFRAQKCEKMPEVKLEEKPGKFTMAYQKLSTNQQQSKITENSLLFESKQLLEKYKKFCDSYIEKSMQNISKQPEIKKEENKKIPAKTEEQKIKFPIQSDSKSEILSGSMKNEEQKINEELLIICEKIIKNEYIEIKKKIIEKSTPAFLQEQILISKHISEILEEINPDTYKKYQNQLSDYLDSLNTASKEHILYGLFSLVKQISHNVKICEDLLGNKAQNTYAYSKNIEMPINLLFDLNHNYKNIIELLLSNLEAKCGILKNFELNVDRQNRIKYGLKLNRKNKTHNLEDSEKLKEKQEISQKILAYSTLYFEIMKKSDVYLYMAWLMLTKCANLKNITVNIKLLIFNLIRILGTPLSRFYKKQYEKILKLLKIKYENDLKNGINDEIGPNYIEIITIFLS